MEDDDSKLYPPAKLLYDDEPPIETKKCVVNTWREIRVLLLPIERMLSYRVKTKIMKDENTSCLGGPPDMSYGLPDFPGKERFESVVRGGQMPEDARGEMWQAFVGAGIRRIKKYYQHLLDQDDIDSNNLIKLKELIEKDVPQTFPGHPALDENGRNSLRRLLLAYALHNPYVGYCQGMNLFAGLLLLLMPEENAFWTLVGILDDYFDGCYNKELIESQVDQLVFEELMHERFPELVKHLDYLEVQVAWITGPWIFSIFINLLPLESVFRVWDVLLLEGNRVMLFRTTLALMKLHGPALFTIKDVEGVITWIQSLVGPTFDCNQLVSIACMEFLDVTEAKLVELREKLRPSVLSFKDDPRSSLIKRKETAEEVDARPCTHTRDRDDFISGMLVRDSEEQIQVLKTKLSKSKEERKGAEMSRLEEERKGAEMSKLEEERRIEVNRLEEERRSSRTDLDSIKGLEKAFKESKKNWDL